MAFLKSAERERTRSKQAKETKANDKWSKLKITRAIVKLKSIFVHKKKNKKEKRKTILYICSLTHCTKPIQVAFACAFFSVSFVCCAFDDDGEVKYTTLQMTDFVFSIDLRHMLCVDDDVDDNDENIESQIAHTGNDNQACS